MKRPLKLFSRVRVSKCALAQAKREYDTKVSPEGKVVSLEYDLVTVEHDDGTRVDWNTRSLTKVA